MTTPSTVEIDLDRPNGNEVVLFRYEHGEVLLMVFETDRLYTNHWSGESGFATPHALEIAEEELEEWDGHQPLKTEVTVGRYAHVWREGRDGVIDAELYPKIVSVTLSAYSLSDKAALLSAIKEMQSLLCPRLKFTRRR